MGIIATVEVPLVVGAIKVLGPGPVRLRMVKLAHKLSSDELATDVVRPMYEEEVWSAVRPGHGDTRVATED